MSSLRLRLIAGGLGAILLALSIAGAGLVLLFERHLARTFASDLDVHLKQLIAGLDVDAEGRLTVTRPPADPRFADPLSGLYWQAGEDDGEILRSRSLWDASMALPPDTPAPGEVHRHEIAGPGGARLLVAERTVALSLGSRRAAVRVAVAGDLARIAAAASAFAQDLALALALLGAVLAMATSVQVGLGLRPLDVLRRGVGAIRAGRIRHLPAQAPREVRPLVEEINALIDAQAREVERSRSRAADLAHGLKTPLAALAADAARLREKGEHAIARDIEAVGGAMSRHVDRELARARLRGTRPSAGVAAAAAPLLRSLIATLARTPDGRRVSFEQRVAETLQLPIDRTDLAEALGNLLENAARHAATRVRITAEPAGPIVIEDDGEGIAPATVPRLMERGARLDERSDGAGLGLAIVQDVLEAYGWQLTLARSELGGLKATIAPGPAQPATDVPVPADAR